MPTYNAQQLLDLQLPPMDWLIDGLLIPGSRMGVFGPKKSWKSMFVSIDMALKLGTGRSWAGFKTKMQRVMVIQEEIPLVAFKLRVDKYLQGHKMDAPVTVSFNNDALKLGRGATFGYNELKSLIKTHQPGILVIDPLYKVMAGDISNSTDMTSFIDIIDKLIEDSKYELAVVIIHHMGKTQFTDSGEAIDRGAQAALGSSIFNNWYDTGVEIVPTHTDEITVKFDDLRLSPIQIHPKRFHVDRNTLTFKDKSDEGKLGFGLLE